MARPSVEDRLGIEDLFIRYTGALDAGDVEAVVACFTPDGALESPAVGRYAGHDAIREFAARFARFRERGNQLRHIISNLAIESDGREATAGCYLAAYLTRNRESRLLATGRYECKLIRGGGGWLFTLRRVVMDGDYTLEGI